MVIIYLLNTIGNPRNFDGGDATLISLQQGHYQIVGIFKNGACGDGGDSIIFSGDCGSNVKIVASIFGQNNAFWQGFANCNCSISFIDNCIVATDKNDIERW
jgi:hypothetical protein